MWRTLQQRMPSWKEPHMCVTGEGQTPGAPKLWSLVVYMEHKSPAVWGVCDGRAGGHGPRRTTPTGDYQLQPQAGPVDRTEKP